MALVAYTVSAMSPLAAWRCATAFCALRLQPAALLPLQLPYQAF